MTDVVKHELAYARLDARDEPKRRACRRSDRPTMDRWCLYGWPALTVARCGDWISGDAFDFYCRTAEVTKEGPFAQAREFYGPHRNSMMRRCESPKRDGCMKECISGTAFSDVVINTFFGLAPSLDGKKSPGRPADAAPVHSKLLNVSAHGKKFTLTLENWALIVPRN